MMACTICGVGAESRRALGGVENREPAAGSRADINEPAAAAKRLDDGIHGARDFRQFAADGGATRASSRFRMRRISSVDLRSSPRERGFRCSVFAGFNERLSSKH